MRKIKNLLIIFFSLIGGLFFSNEVQAAVIDEVPLAVLYSASDFQNIEGHDKGASELAEITKQIYESGNTKISEALICGDYFWDDNVSAEESAKGIESIYSVLNNQWGLEHEDIFFVQGNHDPTDTVGLDITGVSERENYSVYQINHDDYMWSNQLWVDIETTTLETAQNLRGWLEEKIDAGDTRPIFIISHLPLHHSYRYDNPYSEYLFDVMNTAGAKGLNIVYLFGHNHSEEYDSYLGGDLVYLSKGDEFVIPNIRGENAGDYKAEILNFTYMNAGYIGETTDGICSSTVFEIYEDRVEIKRYTKEGLCVLKAAGISSSNDLGWKENSFVRKSPQVLMLNQGTISWEESITSGKIFMDINESQTIKIEIEKLDNFRIAWESSDKEIVELLSDKSDTLEIKIIGKNYGTAKIEVLVHDLSRTMISPMRLELCVFIIPSNAVRISHGENVDFYKTMEDIVIQQSISDNMENEYIISNSNKLGTIKVFAAKHNEYVDVEDRMLIYIPGIGNVLTENEDRNILWRFKKTEGILENVNEYQLQLSPKSLYRGGYYVAATSGIDSGLGYPNLTNMRTSSQDISAGAAVFWFDQETKDGNCLVTTHHYRDDGLKENENGKFALGYDYSNNEFVLRNQTERESVYFYGKVIDEISDVLMWTDANEGKAFIESENYEETGGMIYVMHEDLIEEIPVSLEMLSGYQVNKPGEYTCTLSFNGEILSNNYELNLSHNWAFRIRKIVAEIFN